MKVNSIVIWLAFLDKTRYEYVVEINRNNELKVIHPPDYRSISYFPDEKFTLITDIFV